MDLTKKHCVPCEAGVAPLDSETIKQYRAGVADWNIAQNKKILREFEFKNFKDAMGFVMKVAEIAEAEGHHPDIYIFYNLVRLELSTHAINGLSENDFILAAKIDTLK